MHKPANKSENHHKQNIATCDSLSMLTLCLLFYAQARLYCWHSLLPVDKRSVMWNLLQSIRILRILSYILCAGLLRIIYAADASQLMPAIYLVQLNFNLTFACESLKKFHEIFMSSTQAMYVCITLHAVQHTSNCTSVLFPPVPCHHWILLMHSTWSICIQTLQIMDNVSIYYSHSSNVSGLSPGTYYYWWVWIIVWASSKT